MNINSIYKLFSAILLSLSLGCFFLFLFFGHSSVVYLLEWEIFSLNSVSVVMSVVLDWMSLSFLSVVSFISSMIMGYSIYYMEGDKMAKRFVLILAAFVLSMMFLIISPNLVSLLLGWDGLGLTSYALVIYYQNDSSSNSGMITVLSNRIGDSALLVSIGLMFCMEGWSFLFFNGVDQVVLFLVILAAMTKSAQLPFSAWLPAAMAAPTPVSALVHSSTLVTAGVYLLIRFSSLLYLSGLLQVCLVVGVLTMLMAGWVANFENDLKKVIALSTLSQLGLMFMILGLAKPELAFFHLVMHALFKSTLFMCAGFIIHNLKGSQDSRFAGLFIYSSPVLSVVFSVTNLALCGFPFLAGFYSKDMVLESSFSGAIGGFLVFLVVLATGLTAAYSLRVFFAGMMKGSKTLAVSISGDFSVVLLISAFSLFFLSVVGGFFFSSFMVYKLVIFDLFLVEKFFTLSVLLFVFFISLKGLSTPSLAFQISKPFLSFSSLMIFLPLSTSFYLPFGALKTAQGVSKGLDKGWVEFYGPVGVSNVLKTLSHYLQSSQSVVFMMQYMVLALVLMVFLVLV